MVIDTVKVGSLQTNCYILKKDNKCLIIDPGADYESIKEKLKGLEILGILITHSHFDHVGALEDIANEYHVDILGYGVAKEKCYSIGPFKFNVIFNPGHSNDSISFYFEEEKLMFVGDFIFKDNIGRCDLEGGSITKMYESIDSIKKYKDLMLYPGHGSATTLEYERTNNPYFN